MAVLHENGEGLSLLADGPALAGTVTAIGAVEAFVNACGAQRGPSLGAARLGGGELGGARVLPPALVPGGPGLGLRRVGLAS